MVREAARSDRNYVESPVRALDVAPTRRPKPGRLLYAPPRRGSDRLNCPNSRFARLDLNKCQNAATSRYDIELPLRRARATIEQFVPFQAQP